MILGSVGNEARSVPVLVSVLTVPPHRVRQYANENLRLKKKVETLESDNK